MQNSTKKGFTLIEMSMVLLVIGILATIVLRNIGGQSAIARDTKRIGDLRAIANYLSTYLGKNGYFPNSRTWSELETALKNSNIVDKLPRDPSGKNYDYYYCTDAGNINNQSDINHFILRAQLEQTQSSAPRLWESSVTSTSWTCNTQINCAYADNTRYYCFAQ